MLALLLAKDGLKMDQRKIEEISKQSKAERWPFPRTFDALKEAGVEYYEVSTATHQITYHGGGMSFSEEAPSDFRSLPVAEKFSTIIIKQVIEKHSRGKTHYEEFLQGIAVAGVKFYRVDMLQRTVIYFGSHAGEEYAEKIPAFE
jgi:uncharacterized protein YbcV (DUF1398 family)